MNYKMMGRVLSLILVMLPFFTSMLITNDVALLTFVPFTALLLEEIGQEKALIPMLVLQTVIETDEGEVLSPLPSPTTRAKPTEAVVTPTPDPNGTEAPTNAPNNWAYPTTTPDPNATSAPIVGVDRPEEMWATE